ncbi:MAG: cation:proton antiporter, partial [Leptospirales bacterium]
MSGESFLVQAFVYLSAAVISVPIAKRLGLGSVLGYLIAGIVIGPFALELVGDEKTDVMHFAEFGVVMMLFLIGLELQPALLWRMRAPILGLGGCQVLITGVVIGGLTYFAAGLDWKMSVAIGMTFALSSTAIVLQSLGEKGLLKTPGGQSSFSVLLFQDIAVIPMLAVMPLLAMTVAPEVAEFLDGTPEGAAASGGAHASPAIPSGSHGVDDPRGHGDGEGHGGGSLIAGLPAYLQAIIVLASVGGIVLMGRFLIRPIFRVIAAVKLREIFTATALLLVIGIAVAMQAIGLSPALGTFVAGVVLAESEYRHELETDIEPFKGLLLGLFFIAVGAGIDFELIFAQPGLILGLVAALIAIKFLILMILGRIFGMTASQNLLYSFSLAQGGEFAFVLFSFASSNQV